MMNPILEAAKTQRLTIDSPVKMSEFSTVNQFK